MPGMPVWGTGDAERHFLEEMQIVFIKDKNPIYRVYINATNQEHLRSSDLRWGDEEFTGEKIDYEQTHNATL